MRVLRSAKLDAGQHVGTRGTGQHNGLDWDADDIDPDDDDRKLWVPVMAQTLKTGLAKEDRGHPPVGPATPPRQMTIYTVQ